MITVRNNLCPINQIKQIYINIKSIEIDKNKKVEMISDYMREEIKDAERLATFTDFIFSDKKTIFLMENIRYWLNRLWYNFFKFLIVFEYE